MADRDFRSSPAISSGSKQKSITKPRKNSRQLRNHDTATQTKARAREEPSPGPPASETDARPLGHQPRGGAPARPQLNCGRKAPAGKARKFSALQILRL